MTDEFIEAMKEGMTTTVINKTVQQSSISFRAGTGNEIKLYFDSPADLLKQLQEMTLKPDALLAECIDSVREVLQEKKP
jgi:hypothetical protein